MPHVYLIAGEVACKFENSNEPFVETLTTIIPIEQDNPKFTHKTLMASAEILEDLFKKFIAEKFNELNITEVNSRIFSVSYLGNMTMEEFNDMNEGE